MKPYSDVTDPRVVKALAHPVRAQILGALEGRTASPSELASELSVPLGVTSYHVRRLAALGFLKLVRKTPRRGAIEHYYTANSRPRVTDEAWAAVPPIVKRAMVDATLEHVGGHIRAAASDGGFDVADAHLTRSPVAVDETGWRSLSRELAALTERIRRIESESAERLAGSGHDGELQASVVLMLFQSAPVDSPRQPAAEHPRRRRTRRALKS